LKLITLILLILLQTGWQYAAVAQVYTKARTFTTQNGLSDNSINCFYKDRTGYMWIGSRHGLNRYNGHSFTVFNPGGSNNISNETINAITGEADGTIWVATMNGLNYYKPEQNRWHTIMPGTVRDVPDLPNNLVWDIAFTRDGLLWIASDVFEFSSYNTSTKQFTYYDWPSFAKTLTRDGGSPYTSIQKFVAKSNNEFWLGTTKGLVHLNTETKKFRWIGAGYIGNIAGLVYDSLNGKVFLSAENGQCFAYDEKNNSYVQQVIEPAAYPSNEFTAQRFDEIWLPTASGLLKAGLKNNVFRLCRQIPGFTESLLPGAIKSVYKDDMGLRWVGTTNGIAVFDRDGSDRFLPLLGVSDKSPVNNMGGICFDSISNSYFVCSIDPAVVFIVPADGGTVERIDASGDGKKFSHCNAVKTDNENNIWLLTDNNVYRFNRVDQQFDLFPMPNRGSNVGFRTFLQDETGNYWFGTSLQGIYHYIGAEKKFDSIPFIFLRFTKKIGSLVYDRQRKSVWISAYSSDLIRYDMQSGSMEGFEDRPGLLALNLANDLLIDNRGHLWMATSGGGIIRFNSNAPPGSSFKAFNMQTGLPGNSYFSLCEDAASNIWLLSERGIDVIDSSGKLIQPGTARQGFGFSNFTSDTRSPHNILFNKSRNEIALAVGGGLYLMPATSENRIRPFKVVVTGIKTGGRDSGWQESSFQSLQQLPFHYNKLQVDFAGLYYGSRENIYYEYKLSGYDRQWIRSENYSAAYQNLPAGSFHFQVRARYRNGQVAGESQGFTFQVVPPFWETNLFVIGIVLLVCAAIAGLLYSLSQKLKAEKILNAFTNSLYGQNTIEDISWDTARNCVTRLGFTDCVIYWYEEERQLLVQKAAYGPKNPWQREIYNSMAIPIGKGIVGSVAASGKMEIVKNTMKDPRYIVDDEKRLSEICIPIFVDGKLFGVIDSEHPQRNFYTRFHARLLRKIAAVCAERISRYLSEEKLRGKIARDLHDEMGSTLTSINIMSKVAMEGKVSDKDVKYYLQKIKDNSGRILESIGDMVWVINPANDNFEKLMFRMKEFAAEILEPLKINYHFREEGVLHSVQLNVEQRKEIYMIFKETITNAAKYSGTTELFVTLSENNSLLSMEITDKGSGFDPQQVTNGNGLKNMRARAARIGAEIHIESVKERGTSIFFRLAISPDQGMIS
jgi:signal transduction histidine kinase/ligand-binding sensor domain-containing protein